MCRTRCAGSVLPRMPLVSPQALPHSSSPQLAQPIQSEQLTAPCCCCCCCCCCRLNGPRPKATAASSSPLTWPAHAKSPRHAVCAASAATATQCSVCRNRQRAPCWHCPYNTVPAGAQSIHLSCLLGRALPPERACRRCRLAWPPVGGGINAALEPGTGSDCLEGGCCCCWPCAESNGAAAAPWRP
jgi:hypothetical protein